MYNLEGKVALVTGAGGRHGIGRAIAVRLAKEGADVAVNDVTSNPHGGADSWRGVESVVDEIQSLGRRAISVIADVSDAQQVEAMVDETAQRLGPIDILVNNAGSAAGPDRVPVVELEEEAWDTVQRVNVKGTFLCSRAVARSMLRHGRRGKIIVISSGAGKQGIARYAAYCASKFALIGFTQSLALELAPHGINVNAICPGLVETERITGIATALATEGESAEEYRARMFAERAKVIPLGRVAGAADVADTAAFLASGQSDYLTGLSIPVSGGSMM